jgi:hypothetical protein
MIVVGLMGGLGNQLFQYALGRQLSHQHQTELKLDARFLLDRSAGNRAVFRAYDLDIFQAHTQFAPAAISQRHGLRPTRTGRVLHRLTRQLPPNPLLYITEKTPFRYEDRVAQAPDNSYLSGYWQSPRYFAAIETELRHDLRFRQQLPPAATPLAAYIIEKQAIAVHVRRGDFLTNAYHQVIRPTYYQQAETLVRERVANPHYVVFSDDSLWCRANLRFDGPTTYVDPSLSGSRPDIDLHLMSFCSHFIIPNSTFSWWAVWLNPDPDKVVVTPSRWVNDDRHTYELIDKRWLTI